MNVTFMHSKFLYASQSWAQKKDNDENLTGNENSMMRRMMLYLKIYLKLYIKGTTILKYTKVFKVVWSCTTAFWMDPKN